jgi:hypothetical protein
MPDGGIRGMREEVYEMGGRPAEITYAGARR